MARNPDRFSLQAQLAVAFSNLESAKAEHARQALRLAQHPKDAATQQHVADLEAEIAGHRLTISRLEAAQSADNQLVVEQQDAARTAEIKALADKVRTITDQLDPLLERIVEGLETVGPDLAQYVTLAAQRHQAAHAAARLAFKGKPVPGLVSNGVRADAHGALINALVGAIVRTGIGSLGPSLAPNVVVQAPVHVPTLADAQAALQRERSRLEEVLAVITNTEATVATTTIEETV